VNTVEDLKRRYVRCRGDHCLRTHSSVIAIFETSRDLYDAASSVEGLHEAFRAVSQNVPLVLNILRDCKKVQEQIDRDYSIITDADRKREIEETSKAVEPLIKACQENAKRLQEIFQKVVPEDDASWIERYKNEGQYNHYGPGGMFINPGDGTQHNYSQSGGSGNKQYIGQTQYFGRD
jgi:hypothetical protein